MATDETKLIDDLKAQVEAFTNQVNTLTADREKLNADLATATQARKKDRLLTQAGLDPDRYARFLTGNTEDEWQEALAALQDLRAETLKPTAQDDKETEVEVTHQTTQVLVRDPAQSSQAVAPDDYYTRMARALFGE
jgi:hypothetical protein